MQLSVAGVGVDIVSLQRLAEIVNRSGDRFLRRVYTPREVAEAEAHGNYIASLAARFAAKEAVYKALGAGPDDAVELVEIEITTGQRGEPEAALAGRAADVASRNGIRSVLVSVSWEAECAVAVAVSLGT